MIRRPPRSTLSSSSAASDVYKRQPPTRWRCSGPSPPPCSPPIRPPTRSTSSTTTSCPTAAPVRSARDGTCLLYTSDAADEEDSVDLGGRRLIKKKKNKN